MSSSSRVVHSPDGVNWTQEPDAPWQKRWRFAGVVFNGRMWIFGGDGPQPPYMFNDVWSTTDGVNWTQELAAAAWTPRSELQAVVFNNRMWVMGGIDHSGQLTSDVWSSSDGVNWVQETPDAGWDGRSSFQTVVYRDRIWVLGGSHVDGTQIRYISDAWSSADGKSWVKETDGAPWRERSRHASVVFDNRIWLTGGSVISTGFMNDVWSYGLHIAPDDDPQLVTYVNEPYHADFEAREGDGPFDWSLLSGLMPAGTTLDTNTTSDTIQLTGTPTEKGNFPFTLQLEDADGNVIEREYTLTVINPPPDNGNGAGGSAGTGCTAAPGGLPWLILYGALTLTAAAILRRRDLGG